MMHVEITDTTLKRLSNYDSVVQKQCRDAEQLQWRVMTHEVMQAAKEAEARSRQIGSIVAYARYLHRIQRGQDSLRAIYGEPLLSQALVGLLTELSIEKKMVAYEQSESQA